MAKNKSTLRVACAQLNCVIGDPRSNLAKHLDWIRVALKKECDILVFPELSLTGYGKWDNVVEVSRRADCEELKALAKAASDMNVVVGFIEEGKAGLFYNSAAWLVDGQVKMIQRKINIPTYGCLDEGRYFAKGRSITMLDLNENWTAATLICADVWNPAFVYLAALKKATLLVTPIASTREAVGGRFDNANGWRLTSSYYAMMYRLPMVICNWVGSCGGQSYWGGSRVIDAGGTVIAEAGENEELIVAELDYRQLLEERFLLPTLRDTDPEFVLRELNEVFQEY